MNQELKQSKSGIQVSFIESSLPDLLTSIKNFLDSFQENDIAVNVPPMLKPEDIKHIIEDFAEPEALTAPSVIKEKAKRGRKPKSEIKEEHFESLDLVDSELIEGFGDSDFEIEEKKAIEKTQLKQITKDELIAQLRKYSTEIAGGSREKAINAVKQFVSTGNINDMKLTDYPALMKMIGG